VWRRAAIWLAAEEALMDIVDALVNRQVAKWQAEQEAASRRGEPPPKDVQRPMITLSREDGADDGEVERQVAEALRFDVYGREIIEQVAQIAHVRKQVIESIDERVQGRITNWLGEQFGRGGFSQSEYLQDLAQVLATLGHHGKAIVVGRGAQFLLDPARTLRVRLFAPVEWRVERVAARDQISTAQARARIRAVDADREAFSRRHFGQHIADAAHYDVLLNRSTTSPPVCAHTIVELFRARFGT
jgi:cytidylate kinase